MRQKNVILPKSFLDCVNFFKKYSLNFIAKIESDIKKYKTGVKKIEEAEVEIKKNSELLELKKPILVQKEKFMQTTIQEIEVQTSEAQKFRDQCEEKEKEAMEKRIEAEEKRRIADNNIAEAEAIKEKINSKIESIDVKLYAQLKSYRVPPKEIAKMMQAITAITNNFEKKPLDVLPPEWDFYKKKMNDKKYLEHLISLPKKLETNLLSEKCLKQVEPFINDSSLEPVKMSGISSACEIFCIFFRSMYQLDGLLKQKLIPSKIASEAATNSFNEAQSELDFQKKNLFEVESKLNSLNLAFQEKNREKVNLQIEISESEKKLVRAQKLSTKLVGERARWKEISEELEANLQYLLGNVVHAVIYINFLTPYIDTYRNNFVSEILFKIFSEYEVYFKEDSLTIGKIVGNPFKIQEWLANGLPSDDGNIDNAIVMFNSLKPVLLLDPQKQGFRFINKLYFANSSLYRKTEDSTTNMNFIEKSILDGKVIIFDYINYDLPNELEMLINAEIYYLDAEKELSKINTIFSAYQNNQMDMRKAKKSEAKNSASLTNFIDTNGKVKIIKFSEALEIPVNTMFKFFSISYSPNPSFNSELYGRMSIINFTVTKNGLKDQLLSVITREEAPNEEAERVNNLQKQSELSEKLHTFEEEILYMLGLGNEALLENDTLINKLEDSKRLSDDATIQMNQVKMSEERIILFRNNYNSLAELASISFFSIQELSRIEKVYYYSINWFINQVLESSIREIPYIQKEKGEKKDFKKRVSELKQSFLSRVYNSVCQSLYNKDKLLFAFLLLLRVLEFEGKLKSNHINYLLKGIIDRSLTQEELLYNKKMESQRPKFIMEKIWEQIIFLSHLSEYNGICEDIIENSNKYEIWFYLCKKSKLEIENEIKQNKLEILGNYNEDTILFNFPTEKFNSSPDYIKLLMIKIISLDKFNYYINHLIEHNFNKDLSIIPLFTLNEIYDLTTYQTPLFLLLSLGLDPTSEVERLAEENGRELLIVSLGQGQAQKTMNSIKASQQKGEWVFLQNLHLVPDFMNHLEQIISFLSTSSEKEVMPTFRLWLSALPSKDILPSVLMNSMKTTMESPVGIKSNLLRLMKSQEKKWKYENEIFNKQNKDYEFSKFMVCLIYFHSILVERKSYGSLGWNIGYSFNISDFLIGKNIIKNQLTNFEEISYKAIKYLFSDCIYGGRVTENLDRRVLIVLLDDFFKNDILKDEVTKVNECKNYVISYNKSYENYIDSFESLPNENNPEVVGLHYNALIKRNFEINNIILQSLSELDFSENKGTEVKLDNNPKQRLLNQIVFEADKRLVRSFNIDLIRNKFHIDYNNCMNTILIQEVMRYNSLLNLVFTNLSEVTDAYSGLLPLTDEIEEIANTLLANKTPASWIKKSYPTKKPIMSWIIDLQNRIEFFKNWEANGTPEKFWFSAFFFTQSFLTGIKQNYARENKVGISNLKFDFKYIPESEENSIKEDIVKRKYYLTFGLFLEGAEWDYNTKMLGELSENKVFTKMPSIAISVSQNDTIDIGEVVINKNSNGEMTVYNCPVYICSSRQGSLTTTGHSTNYVRNFY